MSTQRHQEAQIEKIAESAGGKEALLNIKVHLKGEVVGHAEGTAIGFPIEVYYAYPDKARLVVIDKGASVPYVLAVNNGKKRWVKMGSGEVEESKPDNDKNLGPLGLLQRILEKDAKLTISACHTVKLGEQSAIEVAFSYPDYNTVYCYFNSKTYRLLKYKSSPRKDKRENPVRACAKNP